MALIFNNIPREPTNYPVSIVNNVAAPPVDIRWTFKVIFPIEK